jgi:hypothetical protein
MLASNLGPSSKRQCERYKKTAQGNTMKTLRGNSKGSAMKTRPDKPDQIMMND